MYYPLQFVNIIKGANNCCLKVPVGANNCCLKVHVGANNNFRNLLKGAINDIISLVNKDWEAIYGKNCFTKSN